MRDTPLITAVHEAGHAVANLMDRHRFIEGIWIKREGSGWSGYCDDGDARWQPNRIAAYASFDEHAEALKAIRRGAWRDCIGYLAGPISEARWRWRSRAAVLVYGYDLASTIRTAPYSTGSDLARTRDRLQWLDRERVEDQFRVAWDEAEELVASQWPRIVHLGRWLVREQQINGAQVHAWWDNQA